MENKFMRVRRENSKFLRLIKTTNNLLFIMDKFKCLMAILMGNCALSTALILQFVLSGMSAPGIIQGRGGLVRATLKTWWTTTTRNRSSCLDLGNWGFLLLSAVCCPKPKKAKGNHLLLDTLPLQGERSSLEGSPIAHIRLPGGILIRHLLFLVFWTHPTGRRPWDRHRTRWKI